MAQRTLEGCRILVVEDEYLLAEALREDLEHAKAVVVGPAGRLDEAMALANAESMDGAVLDVNLAGTQVYPVADLLVSRSIPLVFATGYDRSSIPERFGSVACCAKPVDLVKVADALGLVVPS